MAASTSANPPSSICDSVASVALLSSGFNKPLTSSCIADPILLHLSHRTAPSTHVSSRFTPLPLPLLRRRAVGHVRAARAAPPAAARAAGSGRGAAAARAAGAIGRAAGWERGGYKCWY